MHNRRRCNSGQRKSPCSRSRQRAALCPPLTASLTDWFAEKAKLGRKQVFAWGYAGVADFDAGRFVDADDKLSQAFALLPIPSLGLWSARAKAAVETWHSAAAHYRETLALTPTASSDKAKNEVQKRAQEAARLELHAL